MQSDRKGHVNVDLREGTILGSEKPLGWVAMRVEKRGWVLGGLSMQTPRSWGDMTISW